MDRQVVKELLQFHLARDIKRELHKLLEDKIYRNTMLKDYSELAEKVGNPGTSGRVAQSIIKFLNQ